MNSVRVSFRSLVRESVVFLWLFLIGFFILRLFCYKVYSLFDGNLPRILILGVIYDIGGVLTLWLLWLLGQILLRGRAVARYLGLVLMVPAFLLGVANSLFVAWAHTPLDPSFLIYLESAGDLSNSALGLFPSWPWVILFSFALLIVLMGGWAFGFWSDKISKISMLCVFIFASIIVVLFGGSLIAHITRNHESLDIQAIAANPVWHFVKFLATHKRIDIGWSHTKDPDQTAKDIRKALITDQGTFTYLDNEYPLIRYNFSFTQASKTKDIWDHSKKIRPNILIFFMESFRALDVGACGSKKGLTPIFDKLAKQGWFWDNFYANGVQTPRAAQAVLCSYYPNVGVSIAREAPTFPLRGLASVLKEYGYETEYFHNGSLKFDNKFPFFRNLGFDTILGMDDLDPEHKYDRHGGWGYGDTIFAKQVAERLNRQSSEKPLFLTTFTVSTHHPFNAPDETLKMVPETGGDYPKYQNCIHYSDHALGVLFESLNDSVLNNTLFVILADHGQPMGEHHNNFALVRYLYEENVRIPFLIYAPAYIKEGRRISEVGSEVDIMPTVLDMLGIKCVNCAVGRSLLSVVEESSAIFSNPYFEGWIGIRKGVYKYIFEFKEKKHSLFDLETDPHELNNIAEEKHEVVKSLYNELDTKIRASEYLINEKKIWRPDAVRLWNK